MADLLSQILGSSSGSQRLMLLFVGAGAFAVIWGFAQWGMAPSWVPVAAGLPIEQVGEATQRLDEVGIEYRMERGGSLLTVAQEDLPRARVTLASEGLTGLVGSPGFELFDQPFLREQRQLMNAEVVPTGHL